MDVNNATHTQREASYGRIRAHAPRQHSKRGTQTRSIETRNYFLCLGWKCINYIYCYCFLLAYCSVLFVYRKFPRNLWIRLRNFVKWFIPNGKCKAVFPLMYLKVCLSLDFTLLVVLPSLYILLWWGASGPGLAGRDVKAAPHGDFFINYFLQRIVEVERRCFYLTCSVQVPLKIETFYFKGHNTCRCLLFDFNYTLSLPKETYKYSHSKWTVSLYSLFISSPANESF